MQKCNQKAYVKFIWKFCCGVLGFSVINFYLKHIIIKHFYNSAVELTGLIFNTNSLHYNIYQYK